jgi:predicted Zn-dependent protease
MTKERGSKAERELAEQFDEALRLRDAGDISGAERILSGLALESPQRAYVLLQLGNVQEKMGRALEAAASYRRATELSPSYELPSISLFHVLYRLGEVDEAFNEMRRFRSQFPSPAYDELIRDINREVE